MQWQTSLGSTKARFTRATPDDINTGVAILDQAETAGQDSATRAIVDWIILGRYAGFRASKWSQTTLTKYARIAWPGSPSRAFTREDFSFLGGDERILGTAELSDNFI